MNFLRFSMDFTKISNMALLLKIQICMEVPKSFEILRLCHRFIDGPPGRFGFSQCGPRGKLASEARRNLASSPAFATEKGRGRSPHSLRGRYRGSAGSGRGPVRGLADGLRRRSLRARLQRSCGEAGPMRGTEGSRGS
jgi:hypothetical protein